MMSKLTSGQGIAIVAGKVLIVKIKVLLYPVDMW